MGLCFEGRPDIARQLEGVKIFLERKEGSEGPRATS